MAGKCKSIQGKSRFLTGVTKVTQLESNSLITIYNDPKTMLNILKQRYIRYRMKVRIINIYSLKPQMKFCA